MTMKILLHKDKKENAAAQMAHLVFADTQANAEKAKRAIKTLQGIFLLIETFYSIIKMAKL